MPRISFSSNGKKHKDFLRLAENVNSKGKEINFPDQTLVKMPPDKVEKKKKKIYNVC